MPLQVRRSIHAQRAVGLAALHQLLFKTRVLAMIMVQSTQVMTSLLPMW